MKGEGQPILFLHGWGGDCNSWLPLTKALGKGYQTVAVDLPGFGLSDVPHQPWTLDDYCNFVDKFSEEISVALNWSKFNLITHSFGGRIAIKLAQKENKIKKAVFIASAGIKHPLSIRSRIGYIIGAVGKKVFKVPGLRRFHKLARKVLYKFLGVHDFEKIEGVMKKTFQNVIKEDLKDQIEKINFPVCIIWGTDDGYVPVKDAYFMEKHITQNEIHIIKGGRHGIHKTHAETVANWINNFLKQ